MREALINYEDVLTKQMLLENTSLLVSSAPFTFVQMEETSALTQRCTWKKDVGILGCLRNWVEVVVGPIDGKLLV